MLTQYQAPQDDLSALIAGKHIQLSCERLMSDSDGRKGRNLLHMLLLPTSTWDFPFFSSFCFLSVKPPHTFSSHTETSYSEWQFHTMRAQRVKWNFNKEMENCVYNDGHSDCGFMVHNQAWAKEHHLFSLLTILWSLFINSLWLSCDTLGKEFPCTFTVK